MVSDYKIYYIACRMQCGKDVREEFAKVLISGYKWVTEAGEHVVVMFGNDAVTVTFGNAEKQISYEEIGTVFLDLIERKYKDIEQARVAEEQEEGIAEDATSVHDVHYFTRQNDLKENEPVGIFSIRMNVEECWFKNTSGLDAEGLCKAYAKCGKPFVEMGKYRKRIDIGESAQMERLDFCIEFNEETDKITIFNGKNFEEKGVRETLFPELAAKLPEMEIDGNRTKEFEAKV